MFHQTVCALRFLYGVSLGKECWFRFGILIVTLSLSTAYSQQGATVQEEPIVEDARLYSEGLGLLAERQFSQARRAFERLVQAYPHSHYALLALLAITSSQDAEEGTENLLRGVEQHMETHRDSGSGPGLVISFKRGDLTGNQEEDIVLLYGYQIGPSRDRSHSQFLVAFLQEDGEFKPTQRLRIGGSGWRYFKEVEVLHNAVSLTGGFWMAGDPTCCPTGTGTLTYIFTDGKLIEIMGSWRRTEQ